MKLTALGEDALGELVNIGVGHAAAALSDLVQCPVELGIPKVEFVDDGIAQLRKLGNGQPFSAVTQGFSGRMTGTAILAMPADSASHLVALLLSESEADVLDAEAPTILTEVGNIIINSLVGMMLNTVGQSAEIYLPLYVEGDADTLANGVPETHQAGIAITINFGVLDQRIVGRMLLVTTMETLPQILQDMGVEDGVEA